MRSDNLYGFGYNKFGQLGNGTSNPRISTPVKVDYTKVLKGIRVKEIHAGNYFTSKKKKKLKFSEVVLTGN